MTVAGTGAICLPLENLKTLLANCAAFQTWTSTADATAAAARIALFAEAASGRTLPDSVIFWGADNDIGSNKIAGGAGNSYDRQGTADIFFTSDIATTYADYEDTLDELMVAFLNDVGGIMDDMDELAGTDEYLNVTGWQKVSGPTRSGKEETEEPLVQIVMRVMWWGI